MAASDQKLGSGEEGLVQFGFCHDNNNLALNKRKRI